MKIDIETENIVREFCGLPKHNHFYFWLKENVKRIRTNIIKKTIWRCIHKLIMLGQDNGEIQLDINNAKDSLYKAILKLK